MPLILPGNVGSATAATGFNVDNSCKFDYASSDHVHKTPGSAGSGTKFVFSTWIKRTKLATAMNIIYAQTATNNYERIRFVDTDKIEISGVANGSTAYNFSTNAVYRDPSAWMHLHVIRDSTQGTASNRLKVYVNGVLQTLAQDTALGENYSGLITGANVHRIAVGNGEPLGAYLAEVILLDGQVITPDGNTGEFDDDSGIWKPLDVSELTFGTTGFYLDFEASDNLGNDANGGDDFTEVNLDATNQTTDTCTNNFATLNPLHSIGAASELSQGNLEYDPSGHHRIISTIAPSSGKWYAEVKGIDNPDKFNAGVAHYPMPANGSASSFAFGQGVNADVGRFANDFGVKANGQYGNDNSYANYMASLESENNNIVGIYLDLDNYKIYFSKNGTLVSSTGKDLTNNGEPYGFISVGEAATFQWNFGNPSFALANTAITDDNGFGAFEYSPNITGDSEAKSFFALCTKNLAEYG
jgi:hypothetical protein